MGRRAKINEQDKLARALLEQTRDTLVSKAIDWRMHAVKDEDLQTAVDLYRTMLEMFQARAAARDRGGPS